jgi:ribonuclease VapC
VRAVVDTSALLAVVLDEPDAALYGDALTRLDTIISTATMVEFALVVLKRLGPAARADALALVTDYEIEVVPQDQRQLDLALDAMLRYGKGRGTAPAVLNYGDLFSYALAKASGLPLLYKGVDFARTDLRSALAASE